MKKETKQLAPKNNNSKSRQSGTVCTYSRNYVGIVLNDIYTENFMKDIVTLLDVHFVTFQGRRAISGFFQYNQVIPNMYMKFTLNFEKPDKTRFEVLDLMIDVCSFLNGTYNRLKIPKLVFTELSKQKGFPKKCPIEANITYTLENYEFEVPQFPLPNLKFIAAVTLYKSDKKHKVIYIGVKGATKRSRS
ncbi:uncharacterized protein LOC119615778 [Lucilia sericata]|uniref:uncharacterized protein LOC119615778 n=1 Tax=Lucilia sericata TaxID=13632 RepID=UPI0018A84774|nr:uncharacterized protein LOC119615778 [Lucilia sericata]